MIYSVQQLDFNPISFLINNKDGLNLYSFNYTKSKFDDKLINGLILGIQNIMEEAFAYSNDEIHYGKLCIKSFHIHDLIFHLIFEGEVNPAVKYLTLAVDLMRTEGLINELTRTTNSSFTIINLQTLLKLNSIFNYI